MFSSRANGTRAPNLGPLCRPICSEQCARSVRRPHCARELPDKRNLLCFYQYWRQKFRFSLCIFPCLSKRWFNRPLPRPIVAPLLELQSELFSPASNDSPSYHHMDVIGDDVVQEALVMLD